MTELKFVKSTGQRQAELRQRRAATGLTEVRGIYATAEQHRAIKTYAQSLIKPSLIRAAAEAPN